MFIGGSQHSKSTTGGRELKIGLSGTVTINSDVTFDVGIEYRRVSGKNDFAVWGIYNGPLELASLVPAVKGSMVDKRLTHVALIVSNRDGMGQGQGHKFGYPVKKGVQVCAIIEDRLNQVGDLLGGGEHGKGLTLRAAWSGGLNFSLDIVIPSKGLVRFLPRPV